MMTDSTSRTCYLEVLARDAKADHGRVHILPNISTYWDSHVQKKNIWSENKSNPNSTYIENQNQILQNSKTSDITYKKVRFARINYKTVNSHFTSERGRDEVPRGA